MKKINQIEVMSEQIWKVKLVVLLLLISGCKEVKNSSIIEITEYISDSTYEKISIDSNALRQGISILYSNPKNNILRETIYKDNKKDGIERGYFPNGSLKYIGKYNMGTQDSTWVWFYDNGNVEKINNWSNGKAFGDSYGYTKEGIIDYHNYLMLGGDAIYYRKYDESGKRVLREDGVPIYIMINSFRFKEGDSLNITIFITADEDFYNNYSIIKLGNDKEQDVAWVSNKVIGKHNSVRHSKVFHLSEEMNSIGRERILINIQLVNVISKKVFKYIDTINVDVREK